MGCSVRFADNPGRTKERRIEGFAGQHAPRPGKAKETRRVEAEGEAEMSENEKSTDPELSAAERKELRGREAKEAVADHEAAQQAFHENRERLREERLAREAAAGPMLYPAPELPDDTPIESVRFSTRIRNVVIADDHWQYCRLVHLDWGHVRSIRRGRSSGRAGAANSFTRTGLCGVCRTQCVG